MFLKKFIIPIIILFLIILILAAILILLSQPQTNQPTEPKIPVEISEPKQEITKEPPAVVKEDNKDVIVKEFDDSFLDTGAKAAVPSKTDADKAELRLFVRNFLEDFGSFSSNSGYKHIEDLYDKMTAEFRDYVENWLESDPSLQLSPEFYSIETRVSEVKIDAYSSNKAKLIADIARVETKAPQYYGRRFVGTVEVGAVKAGGEWNIASVYWK